MVSLIVIVIVIVLVIVVVIVIVIVRVIVILFIVMDQKQYQAAELEDEVSGSFFVFRSTSRRTSSNVASGHRIFQALKELGLWVNVVENTLLAVALLGRKLCGRTSGTFSCPRAL